jgi:hypothetical protein
MLEEIGTQNISATIPTDEEIQAFLYEDEDEVVESSIANSANASNPPVDPTQVSKLVNSEQEDELDDDLLLEPEADRIRTQVGFAANPLARLGLASVCLLSVVGVVGLVIGGFQSSTQPPPVIQASASPTPMPLPTTIANADGATKEQLAFQQQKELMKGQKAPATKLSKVAVAKTQPTSTPAPMASQEPIASPTPIPPALPEPIASPPQSPIAVVPMVPIDPNKEWADLAQSGTFGALPPTVLVSSSNSTPLLLPSPIAISPPSRSPEVASTLGFPSLSTYANQKKLKIGTQATATLINPIAWLPDGKEAAFANSPKFIVRLDEPLKGIDGETVIPSGAELVVAVRSLDSKTGLADLTALQVIINQQEYSPPTGAITIRGEGGKPLMADKLQDKGKEIASGDMALILFGSLAKVGGILNQPNSSTSIATGLTTVNSVSNSPNILGAALEGGFSVLAQQQQQRNQQWLTEIASRPDVRFIPAGKRLQVFINQTITL